MRDRESVFIMKARKSPHASCRSETRSTMVKTR
jgi:hypothetical protein